MKQATKTKRRTASLSTVLAEARAKIEQGDYESALNLLETRKEQFEDNADFLGLMSVVAIRVENIAYAIMMLQRAQDLPEASTDIPEVLAVLFALVGNLPESLYYAKLSTTREHDNRLLGLLTSGFPAFADVFTRIREKPLVASGEALLAESRYADALGCFSQHVALNPGDEEGYDGLTRALIASGDAITAVNILRSLRMMAPQKAAYASRLGKGLALTGEHAAAAACHRQAIILDPQSVECRYAYLRDLAYAPDIDGVVLERARQGLSGLFQERSSTPPKVQPQPRAQLIRVGYLIGGVSDEDGIAMLAEIIRHHDRSRVRLIALGHGDVNLPSNRPFQMRFDRWVNVRGVNERTFASVVRGEGIDVLVDLGGLQAPEHVFAVPLHAAPVQVSWRIEPVDFSVPGIDYELVDGLAGKPALGRAKPWKLTSGLYAFKKLDTDDTPVFPAQANGYVSFGVDATLAQLNPELAMTFCRILSAVPDSMLLLRDAGHCGARVVQKLLELFGNFGMVHRVDVVTAASRGEFFRETDIQLIPFPFARPYLAAEAIGGGVPVVALNQLEEPGREIAYLLRRLGLADGMLASTEDDYVAAAVRWAQDAATREAFWSVGRGAATASEVFSPASLATQLEDAYTAMLSTTPA